MEGEWMAESSVIISGEIKCSLFDILARAQ